jgi:hypothetical protein
MVLRKKGNPKQLKIDFNGHAKVPPKKSPRNLFISKMKSLYSEFNFFERREKSFQALKKRYNNFSIKELNLSENAVKKRVNLINIELESFKKRKNSSKLSNPEQVYVLFLSNLNKSSTKVIGLIEEYKKTLKDFNKYNEHAEGLRRSYASSGDKEAADGVLEYIKDYRTRLSQLQKKILNEHADNVTKYDIFIKNIDVIKKRFNIS